MSIVAHVPIFALGWMLTNHCWLQFWTPRDEWVLLQVAHKYGHPALSGFGSLLWPEDSLSAMGMAVARLIGEGALHQDLAYPVCFRGQVVVWHGLGSRELIGEGCSPSGLLFSSEGSLSRLPSDQHSAQRNLADRLHNWSAMQIFSYFSLYI